MLFAMKWLFPYDCVAKYFYMLSLFLALSDIKRTSMILIPSMMHSQKPGMAGLWHVILFFLGFQLCTKLTLQKKTIQKPATDVPHSMKL